MGGEPGEPMQEMQVFYEACFPRIEEVLEYCDKFPLDAMPDDARHLLELVHSTVMVSMCVGGPAGA